MLHELNGTLNASASDWRKVVRDEEDLSQGTKRLVSARGDGYDVF